MVYRFYCLYDLILYVPVIQQLSNVGKFWVEPVLSKDKCVLLWSCSMTQRSNASEAQTRNPFVSSQALYHWPMCSLSILLHGVITLQDTMTMSSTDNFCKQIGPRSGPAKCWALSGSILFETDGIPERIFRKSWFWKKSADDKKSRQNYTEGRVNLPLTSSQYIV